MPFKPQWPISVWFFILDLMADFLYVILATSGWFSILDTSNRFL